jgi:protocatechuate 3,4-dioxygenase beta subunit
MKNEALSTRRRFLKAGIGTAGAAALSFPLSRAIASTCGITPTQTSGPFYPGENQFHRDNDLTRISGSASVAKGQLIYIQGRILDNRCNPVSNANVEIWQACASGRYNNPKDTNPAPLDPAFKYWGETFSDADGNYVFRSIKPGAYPADTNWIRPPHIHFKVSRLGYKELITQLYFKGEPLNELDLILNGLSGSERSSVIVDFQSSARFGSLGLIGKFDITLQSVR